MIDLVVIRDAGGLGDVIRIYPVIDALAATTSIAFCTDATYADACQLCPSIADGRVKLVLWSPQSHRSSLGPLARKWSDLTMPYATGGFDLETPVVDLFCPALIHEVTTHGRPKLSRLECWAAAAGLPRLPEGCIKLVIPEDLEHPAAHWRGKLGKKPVVALAPSSNASIRTWRNGPSASGRVGRIGGLIHQLRVRGFQTVIFSSEPSDVPGDHASVHPDIRVQAARLARCDLFIGPDTGMLHVACALGLPVVTMFGPTHARLVLDTYSNPIRVLNGRWGPDIWRRVGCDRPCYGLPSGGYNHTTCSGRCVVMEQITEEMVADEAEKLMKPLVSLRVLT